MKEICPKCDTDNIASWTYRPQKSFKPYVQVIRCFECKEIFEEGVDF